MIWLLEIVVFFILWATVGIVPAILIEAVCIFATLFYNHSKAQAAIGVALVQGQQAALAQQQALQPPLAALPARVQMPAPPPRVQAPAAPTPKPVAPVKTQVEVEWDRDHPFVSYDAIATGATPEERVASIDRFVEERGIKGVRFIESLEHEDGPHMVEWDFEDEGKDHHYYAINFRQMLATIDQILYGDTDLDRDDEETFHLRQHEGKWQLRCTNCSLDYAIVALNKKGEADPTVYDAEWIAYRRQSMEKMRGVWFDAQFSEINPSILEARYSKFVAAKRAK